jgi:hypothetical protein
MTTQVGAGWAAEGHSPSDPPALRSGYLEQVHLPTSPLDLESDSPRQAIFAGSSSAVKGSAD